MKKIARYIMLIAIPLILVGCSSSTPITTSGLSTTPNPTDISTTYLTMIFGSMGHILIGNGNQLVGMLFSVFNYSIIGLTGLFLIYNVFTMILGGVIEGSLQGKGGKHSLLIMRIGIGVVLMIPSPSSGYSVAQDLVMDGTIAGINLANTVWSSALDFVSEGHVLWDVPGENSPSITSIILGTNDDGSEVTGDVYQRFMVSSIGDSASGAPTSSLAFYVLHAEECSMIKSQNTLINPRTADGTTTIQFKGDASDAQCGSINWSLFNPTFLNPDGVTGSTFCLDTTTDATDQLYCEDVYRGISAVVSDLMPAAAQLACTASNSYSGCDSVDLKQSQSVIGTAISQAQIDYATNVYAIYDDKNKSTPESSRAIAKMVDSAEGDGWLMAGRFYYLLADHQLNDTTTLTEFGSTYTTTSTALGLTSTSSTSLPSYSTTIEKAMGVDNIGDFGSCSDDSDDAACLLYNYATTMDSTIQSNSGTTTKTKIDLSGVAATWFSCGIDAINKIFAYFDNASNFANPVTFLVGLGALCLNAAGGMWEGMLTFLGLTGLAAFIAAPGFSSLGYVFKIGYKWAMPLLLVMIGLLVSCGASLFYYLPFYPFILFIMASVGWFISVIEAMVAVPLVAYGLTSPDGNHDLLGRGEQSIMLFLSVIFRPVLMIIGLVAGMVISYAAFSLLNHTFAAFISDLYKNGNITTSSVSMHNGLADVKTNLEKIGGKNTGNDMLVALITTPMFLTVFATLAVEITHQCYSLIHQLPEYVLRWVGGPQGAISNMIDKAMSNVKEGQSGASQSASDALTTAASGFQKTRDAGLARRFGSINKSRADSKRSSAEKGRLADARAEGIKTGKSQSVNRQTVMDHAKNRMRPQNIPKGGGNPGKNSKK